MIIPILIWLSVARARQASNTIPADLRVAVLNAENGREAGQAYQNFFTSLTLPQLQSLKTDPDIGIALQVAWELARKGDAVAVFGTESHGAYAEGFRISDGKPVFRFCSCYWFNFSETWNLPWGGNA